MSDPKRDLELDETSPPDLLLLIGVLVSGVAVADLLAPLGIAVWVFYLVPLAACLRARSASLPYQVAAAATLCTALLSFKPLDGEALVRPWLAVTNRAMYIATFWPVAFMVSQLISSRKARQREEWLRGSKASLLSALQGELSLQEVGTRTLARLAEAIGAQTGALYFRGPSGFTSIASHAVDATKLQASFQLGEGLIGQVAQSRQPQLLADVPAGFLHVEAGIGAGPPRHLGIAPLCSDGETLAVVALGSLRPIDEVRAELLERVSEPVARALTSAHHKVRLRELLTETRRQAEELQSQQAELEAQQSSLEEQQTELEASNQELNQANALMEVQNQELTQQRKELEQERQAAERASRYKSEFLANMSHELRTPLNSSLILARLLADNKEGNLTTDQVRSAETIYSAGNDLLTLINDILDLSKIEAGRADINPEPVLLSRVLDGLTRTFTVVARNKQLEFSVTREPGAPDRITTDGRRLEQILKNLLSNAFKFTARGSVELRVVPAQPNHVRFSVRDTGIGIAPEQQNVIFEAFRQADGTTSRKYGGTGLGLSISRELVQLLGGTIELQSAPDAGSTFSVLLPLQLPANLEPTKPQAFSESSPPSPAFVRDPRPTSSRSEPAQPADDDRSKLTRPGRLILAIEDDVAFGRILYDLAHELDFDCVLATTAEEGYLLARELQPSGVLLDVHLPDASGLALLDRLKRAGATRHIPIHMVSVADNVQTALELGAIGYALKPVARADLVRAMQLLQEKHSREVRRVLVVEDDVRQRDSIKQLLGGHSVQLVTAGSVKEALSQLEQSSFDCMVLDLTLPDGSGYEVLEKMAEGTRYSFPPVIVYTGRDLDRADEERLRRYSQSIIVKGARSPERLLDEVTLFLHQVESSLPAEQRRILADVRQRESAFEGRRILIVEDDVRNVFALTKVLEPRGARVEIARDGREALEFLERDPKVDLVLMDLMMPQMDGLTAIAELRKQPGFRRLPIIALTAKAMPDDQRQAIEAGANDYMTKPFDVDKLVSLCRVWLPR